jgi:hypothetical protein
LYLSLATKQDTNYDDITLDNIHCIGHVLVYLHPTWINKCCLNMITHSLIWKIRVICVAPSGAMQWDVNNGKRHIFYSNNKCTYSLTKTIVTCEWNKNELARFPVLESDHPSICFPWMLTFYSIYS